MSESTESNGVLTADESRFFETGGEEGGTEAIETTEQAEPQAPQRDKMVPHAALHEERKLRQARDAEVQQLREERARYDERLKILQERWQPTEQQSNDPPDIDKDARGYVEWIGRQTQAIQQQEAQRQQQTYVQQQVGELRGWASSQEAVFRQEAPDWDAAANFLKQNRIAEFRAMGTPDTEIQKSLDMDLLMIAQSSRQSGVNPAQRLYEIAKLRGYQPQQGNQAVEQAETIQRGQRMATAAPGGGGGVGAVTADQLLAMSAEEFDAFSKKNPAQLRRIMGE